MVSRSDSKNALDNSNGSQELTRFERIELVLRALCGDSDISLITTTSHEGSIQGNIAYVPNADESDAASILFQEASMDLLAVRHSRHNIEISNKLKQSAQNKPITLFAKLAGDEKNLQPSNQLSELVNLDSVQLHEMAENLRLSLIGGRTLSGIRHRIPHWWETRLNEDESTKPHAANDGNNQQGETLPNTPISITMAIWQEIISCANSDNSENLEIKSRFSKLPVPLQSSNKFAFPDGLLDIKNLCNELLQNVDDQENFSQVIDKIYNQLTEPLKPKHQDNANNQNQNNESDEEEHSSNSGDGDSDQNDQSEISEHEISEDQSGETDENGETKETQSSGDDDFASEIENESGIISPYTPPRKQSNDDKYHSYTTEFDVTTQARTLVDDEREVKRLRDSLDKYTQELQSVVTPLAIKLQKALLAVIPEKWDDNLDQGYLNPARLARVAVKPTRPGIFRKKQEVKQRDSSVTLLIDNSGSMRGHPIRIATMCAELLTRTLERCQIRTEVLGYTTNTWKGGESFNKWRKSGRPSNPGRLNDLLHVIYKPDNISWQNSRAYMALMLRENMLKENIDGEALLWALSRIKKHNESRKILIVISDGAPVDDMTLSYNQPDYLDKHLKEVTKSIEKKQSCELIAIGIGYDVGRFYTNAIRIPNASSLAKVMMDELTKRLSN